VIHLRTAGKLLTGLAVTAAVALVALGMSGMASAKGKANTKLTIQGGGGLVQGEVKSPNENACADGRKVLIFRVKDGNSEKVASDRATQDGDRYQWAKGFDGGRYFAKVKENSQCKGDSTETVSAGRL
jgi:hypothetical protein